MGVLHIRRVRRNRYILTLVIVVLFLLVILYLSHNTGEVANHTHLIPADHEQHNAPHVQPPVQKKSTLVTIKDYLKNFEDDPDTMNKQRRAQVRQAMQHAFSNYEKYAWGMDELAPVSKTAHNWIPGGVGLTIIDAVDTLYIMGLEDEFNHSVEYLVKEFPQLSEIDNYVSLFEITIRMLGGFLSAYDLSGHEIFLTRAKELAERLLPAFGTENGIPHNNVNLKTKDARTLVGCRAISEFGTLTMEFTHLTTLTGLPQYKAAVDRVMQHMERVRKGMRFKGLYPVNFDAYGLKFCDDRITMGALGDSFYEYLHKSWLLSDKKDETSREMFEESVQGIMDHILVTSNKGWRYISEMRGGTLEPKIDHLVCFAAGMFALSNMTNATPNLDPVKYDTLQAGKDFIKSCVESYNTQTGLGPEIYRIGPEGDIIIDEGSKHYILRPETVESLMLLYRVTGDNIYREMGWKIFKSIEENCRVEGGYSGVRDVRTIPPAHDDLQQSFFLAETLKYLYLLFSPNDVIPLDEYVFNTEAHPFRIKR